MTTYGLTPTGWVSKTLTEIVEELNTTARSVFGDATDVTPQTPMGQLITILAEREALLWELGEALSKLTDSTTAVGAVLDYLCALVGVTREGATKSTVTLTLSGEEYTVIPVGRQVSASDDSNKKFVTLAEATLVALPLWVTGTTYALGDRVRNSAEDYGYECITAGVSHTEPTGTGTSIAPDGEAHAAWKWIGGWSVAEVAAECSVTGPTTALARILTVIDTPVAGWSYVINLLDADVGSAVEEDPDLRIRRAEGLVGTQGGAADSIRAAILQVDGVESVRIFENKSTATNEDGVPAKSVECCVDGGDDTAVAQAVWNSCPAGIYTHGAEVHLVTDSAGNPQYPHFSRPTDVNVYVAVYIAVDDPDLYPADAQAQILAALLALGDSYVMGQGVYSGALERVCWVPGVRLVECYVDTSPDPTTRGSVAVDFRERAKFDSTRITFEEA